MESKRHLNKFLDYLDSQDKEISYSFRTSSSPDEESVSAYSETKARFLSMKTELEEAHKTMDTLKYALDKAKHQREIDKAEWEKNLSESLEAQKKEYENIIEKNMNFLESLLKEKEERNQLIAELRKKLKDCETGQEKQLESIKQTHKKEMKKAKDNWFTTEKLRKEKWEKEKTKEIKEITARGLEPEILRIVNEHKKTVEDLKLTHTAEINSLTHTLEEKHYREIVSSIQKGLKDTLSKQFDEQIERERQNYSFKLKEQAASQENDIQEIRARWLQDMLAERNRIDEQWKDEVSYWKAKFQQAEQTIRELRSREV